MKNRFGFKSGKDVQRFKELPAILQLQMYRNAMLASIRWCRSLAKAESEVRQLDQLIACLGGAAWAAEGLKVIEKNSAVLRCELLSSDESRRTWDECFTMPRLAQIDALFRARDKCFAHWDRVIAEQCIDRVANDEIEPVFMEWNDKQNSDSVCTMAYMAVVTDFLGPDVQPKKLAEVLHTAERVALMIDDLLVGVLTACGITRALVRWDP